MSDLERWEPPQHTGAAELVSWASGMSAAAQLANGLASTAFVPAHFRGKTEDCAAAILAGAEVGLSPLQALRSTFVIGGQPAYYARTMVALVQREGHEVWTEVDTPAKAVVCGRRRGSSHVEKVEFTIDRATKAGYTRNQKYASDPQAMLWARAASIVCRRIAQDALLGIPFSAEELEDEGTAVPQPVTVARRGRVAPSTQRHNEPAPALTPAEETPQQATERAATVAEVVEVGVTSAQIKKLAVVMKGLSRDQALERVSQIIGRNVASRNELTKTEASQVIDALTEPEPEPAEVPLDDPWATDS